MNRNKSISSRVPHMSSIWLDKDENIEKLYNFQSEQFLRDEEDDENFQIFLMNSSIVSEDVRTVPVSPLSQHSPTFPSSSSRNSSNISPVNINSSYDSDVLTTDTSDVSSDLSKTKKTKSGNLKSMRQKLLGRLRKKWGSNYVSNDKKKNSISTPFHFQHIFHANLENNLTTSNKQNGLTVDTTGQRNDDALDNSSNIDVTSSMASAGSPISPITFGKAYCTEEIKSSEYDRDFRRLRNSDTTQVSFEMENYLRGC